MTQPRTLPSSASEPEGFRLQGREARLRAGSLGVPAIVFFVVAAAAPLAAILGAGPVAFIFAGAGAPAMYVIAAVVLLLFGVGFAAMSRHVTSAGGFAAFAAKGLGRHAGYVMAGVALLAYAGMLIGLFGQFAVFAADLLSSELGLDVSWQAMAFAGVVLVGVLGYFDVRLSASVLGVLMILEVLILVVFDIAVIVAGGAGGLDVDAFAPSTVVSPDMGAALLFAFSCYVGFEATVIYGEEAREPRVTVPRATYAAILIIGVIYTATMWALGLAYGTSEVQAAAIEDPLNFVFDANTKYVGGWSTTLMQYLVVTSLVAVLLAFHNTLSRYVFSLGRARFLPQGLGRTHRRHHSPSRASLLLTAVSAAVLTWFVLGEADPFTTIYLWLVGTGTLGVLVLQAAGAAAVVGYFTRHRASTNATRTVVVSSTVGGIGLVVAIWLGVQNFDLLTGVTEGPATLLPTLLVVSAVAGLILGITRSRDGHVVDVSAGSVPAEPAAAHDRA